MEHRDFEQYVLARIDALEEENERLRGEARNARAVLVDFFSDGYTEEFRDAGRKAVFKASLSYARDADGLSFEEWCRRTVYEVPDFMSRDGYMEEFSEELREEYRLQGGTEEA